MQTLHNQSVKMVPVVSPMLFPAFQDPSCLKGRFMFEGGFWRFEQEVRDVRNATYGKGVKRSRFLRRKTNNGWCAKERIASTAKRVRLNCCERM